MSFSYYGELCTEVYDVTKKIGQSLGGDIKYYQERLKNCKGRILEAMVESGRVMIPLLESGLTVEGVDYSPEMLASCRQRCHERGLIPNLYEADLKELREDSIEVLKRLQEHLVSGGRIILDLFLPDKNFEVGSYKGTSTVTLPNGDIITMEEKLVAADLFNQYKVSYLKYEKWRQGKLIQSELQRFALRWYGVEEFKLLLESISFSDVQISADYCSNKQPTNSNQQYIYEACKK